MKQVIFGLLIGLTHFLGAQEEDKRMVIVPIADVFKSPPKEAPLFFSVVAEVKAHVSLKSIDGEQSIDFRIHQGKPETLTLALSGPGDVVSVTGEGLRDWAVRTGEAGARFLDVRPVLAPDGLLPSFKVVVKSHLAIGREAAGVLLPAPGSATGFSLSVALDPAEGVDLKVVKADGLQPVRPPTPQRFLTSSAASLDILVAPAGFAVPDLELTTPRLTGQLAADGNSVAFHYSTQAKATKAGAVVEVLGGSVALAGSVSGDGWHLEIRKTDRGYVHDLVADRAGDFPVEMDFVAAVHPQGDWRSLDFRMPAGVFMPMEIRGLGEQITFNRSLSVVPTRDGDLWRGFLPANGEAKLGWRITGAVADGALAFSSSEATDVRVGSGLMRELVTMDLRVFQGQLSDLSLAMEGPGEVLAVTGEMVLGWSVSGEAGDRKLSVKLARPIEGSSRLVIEAQAALGGFPVRTEALRFTPIGSVRHGGWLRIATDGAVRIDVTGPQGLIQLAPSQFPIPLQEAPRQLFVYRFPSADYGYEIRADQVLPEVSVTEVTVYELAEMDRRVVSDIELDIREAPLREWELEIAADLAVASVTGAQVADYAVASEVIDGKRRLKIMFKGPVISRQLVTVHLEKNDGAKAGPWDLQPLGFPAAKSRRGYIGALATAGFRLVAGKTSGVVEVPVTFFPKKIAGLQQAFRIRDGDWQASLTIEALGQSVQADVFHLYSLKAGAAYGSVLINYFVVGAPATEWRISVPESIGNIDVTGQSVGRDWRREGSVVIVPLSRPVLGTGTVLLTFEQPMSARGGDLSPGEVRPLDVQAERGYIQVVSPLQVKFEKPVSEGPLLPIDATELPAEFRLLSSAPTLGAWQYTARDFKIGIKLEWFSPGETVEQAIDFLKLATKISRDGEWITDAQFFVKSRGRNGLRTTLPAGAELWEAKVNGEMVNARADGNATLIPLPLKTDPNEAVQVSMRYGARGSKATRVHLGAPKLDAPVVIGEWKVTGDEGRQLVPRGGTAQLVSSGLAESGWHWVKRHPAVAAWVLVLGAAAWLLGMGDAVGMRRVLAVILGAAFVFAAGAAGVAAATSAVGNADGLEYAVPVMAAGSEVAVDVSNLAPWLARTGWLVWLLFISGVGLVVGGQLRQLAWARVSGYSLLGAALLTVHAGATAFFGAAALVGFAWCLPRVRNLLKNRRPPKIAEVAAAFVMIAALSGSLATGAEPPPVKLAESMRHDWQIRDGRLHGDVEVTVRAEMGDRFLLLRSPAVLGGFEAEGLRVIKEKVGDADAYFVVAESAGVLTGKAKFEMPLLDPGKGWEMPGGPAALRHVNLRWNQPGWEFLSTGAARVVPLAGLGPDESGVSMTLVAADPIVIQARPKQRDAGSEETRFFAEVSNLYLPGPGVVNGRHLISIRPAQGRVASLMLTVPEGFTVSDVTGGPVGAWRFDPAKRELRVPVEPAQEGAFTLTVETQRGTGPLPIDLEFTPLRVTGAAGEIGYLALAFGDDAQPESTEVVGLSRVNLGDFGDSLLPRDAQGNPSFVLQDAFRYGSAEAIARVKVTPVLPELRAESWQLVSLGDDRLVVSTELTVTISRAGVFRLELQVPDGLEIETATGEGLSHWSESRNPEGPRMMTLHLTEKSLGRRVFNLTLTGRPPGAQERWQVPHLSLNGASRETGVLILVPERGLQIRPVERKNVSQIDPRELVDTSKDAARAATQPGALPYRLLQSDWALSLAISRLEPWVRAQVFHETTLREGQVLTHVGIGYKIENAAVKSLRIRIPGLDATAAATVRANGPAVADYVAIEPGLWEIRLQRGIAGETQIELEYQRATRNETTESVEPIQLVDVRQIDYFAVIRAGGRLELEAGDLPRGWQRADWAVVQTTLGSLAGNVSPVMAFRVADPEGPLPVTMKRHQLADLQKLRVGEGVLTTLVSPAGVSLTAVDLKMQVVGKETLRLKLPAGSSLFNVMVNDEGANLVREGEDWLFYVFPSPEENRPASVHFVFSSKTGKETRLEGPALNVPMENLTWRVLVPRGWKMTDHGGDFDLRDQGAIGSFGLADYQSLVRGKRDNDSKNAVALLDQANGWLAAGDQEKASQAFSNAVRSNQLDAASGEDARVQLRELKTQQAVLGLNTRRQKLAIDNRSAAPQEEISQLERAAEANPVLRGDFNYDPKQFERFFEGNTSDENSALKEIANRIVTQQLAAEPAPVALDVTLPERGTLLTFGRSVQVDGEAPMVITLKLKRIAAGPAWLAIPLCLLLGAMGAKRRVSR